MGTTHLWDHPHGCIISVQLRCHARTDRLCSNPHFMNSFPNYRSGGAPNVLFLEYRSKIQNDWKLLKCMYLSTVTLLNGVTDMDYRRCIRPAGSGQVFELEGRSASTAPACMVHRRRGRSRAACAFLIFSAVLGRQVVISLAVGRAPQSCHSKVA